LHPIKLAQKEVEEEEDILSPLPPVPQHAHSLQLVRISSSNNSHSASIRSLNVNHSPASDIGAPVVTNCTVVIENNPTRTLTEAANKLQLTAADQLALRTEVKNSSETLVESDKIELVTASQDDLDTNMQEIEVTTDFLM